VQPARNGYPASWSRCIVDSKDQVGALFCYRYTTLLHAALFLHTLSS
jgi:hypothetical protein